MAALLCGGPCRALGPVCGACDDCCCPEGRPSPLFLGYTAALNGVGGALGLGFGIKALVEGPCREGGELPAFLLVGLGTNVFFILFAVHLYRQFSKPYNPLDFTGTDDSPYSRATHICMYDPWAAAFILLAVFDLVWASVGMKWARDKAACDATVRRMGVLVGTLHWIYLAGGLMVMLISLSVECSRYGERSSPFAAVGSRRAGGGREAGSAPASPLNLIGSTVGWLLFPQNMRESGAAGRNPPQSAPMATTTTPAARAPVQQTTSRSTGAEAAARAPPSYRESQSRMPAAAPPGVGPGEVAIGIPVEPQAAKVQHVPERPSAPPVAPPEAAAASSSRAGPSSSGGAASASQPWVKPEQVKAAKVAGAKASKAAAKGATQAMAAMGKGMKAMGKMLEDRAADQQQKRRKK